ncbi:zinc finger BED domain-containing protein RICESLEEPER 2-like protein [Tanacetum coccineum]
MPTSTTGCCLVAVVALATWPQQQRLSLLRRTNRPCVSTFKDLVTKYSSRAPRGFNGRISYACYNVHCGEEETTTVVPNPLLGSTGDKERNRRSIGIDVPVCLGLTLVKQTQFYLSQITGVPGLYNIYYTKYGNPTTTESSSGGRESSSKANGGNQMTRLLYWLKEHKNKKARSDLSVSSEYERYVHSDFVTHLQTTEFATFDVLGFWKANETMFPYLFRMAMDIQSVQSTSVASESAFSTSGRVLPIRRTRLTPASLEMCMCSKDHLDAQERKQDKSTLETPVNFEDEILDADVQENEAIPLSDEKITLEAASSEVASEFAFSTSGRVLPIRRTRLTPAFLEMCMCSKDHLDAQERKQDKSTLETPVNFEDEILDADVQENEVIPLSDEKITLDAASSEGSMSGPGWGGEKRDDVYHDDY